MKEKKKRKKLLFIVGGVVSALFIGIASYYVGSLNSDEQAPHKKDQEEELLVFDPNVMPTWEEVDEVSRKALFDIYGLEYGEDNFSNSDGKITIPGTSITFDSIDITGEGHLLAMTIAAMQKNPYAVDKNNLIRLEESSADSVREMPDGDYIDLANLEQDYTNVKYFVDPANAYNFKFKGYCNDTYFEEQVSLAPHYEKYYSK